MHHCGPKDHDVLPPPESVQLASRGVWGPRSGLDGTSGLLPCPSWAQGSEQQPSINPEDRTSLGRPHGSPTQSVFSSRLMFLLPERLEITWDFFFFLVRREAR